MAPSWGGRGDPRSLPPGGSGGHLMALPCVVGVWPTLILVIVMGSMGARVLALKLFHICFVFLTRVIVY